MNRMLIDLVSGFKRGLLLTAMVFSIQVVSTYFTHNLTSERQVGLKNLWAFEGTPLISFDFQFSTPITLISTNDLNSDTEGVVYGDKSLQQVTFPFLIGLNLGYIFSFDKLHFLLGNMSLRYSDDPINFLFDSSIASKVNAPSFTSKSLNLSLLLKYILKNSVFDFATSFGSSFSFTKDANFGFSDNIYNFYSFNVNPTISIKSVPDMRFDVGVGYTFNYYPKGIDARLASDGLTEYPEESRSFHTAYGSFNYIYKFAQSASLGLGYNLGLDLYLKKKIHNGDLTNPQILDENERTLRHTVNLSMFLGFLNRGGYNLIDLSLAYLFKYNDSNYVELVSFTPEQAGDRANELSAAIQAGSQFIYYQKDFKDFFLNVASMNSAFNLAKQYQITIGYSLSTKKFTDVYGRYGADHSVYGAYKDEARLDLSHIISLGFTFKTADGNRRINPYLGLLIDTSNDATVRRNRHIYFIGIKGVYEI